ncbi:MAG: sigma-70 family RNA polymerase sigma factor [Tannerella sp.]|jgi:RNA polymerase sigma-70 factor (ECF subfamily)|nr:sigma-70 family RNA polymerase sigma factor [Tannerella sp.]
MSEKQLIAGCLKGDRKSQKELYDLYSRKMMGVCLRYAGERETARDLLQDGFVKVFTSLDRYAGTGTLEGWIRAVFVNNALEHLRKRDILRGSADLESLYEAPGEGETTLSKMAAGELMTLVQSLPEGFRAVFNMYAIEGYSHKEIAGKLHITESTSRSQYVRARKWLQERIARYK